MLGANNQCLHLCSGGNGEGEPYVAHRSRACGEGIKRVILRIAGEEFFLASLIDIGPDAIGLVGLASSVDEVELIGLCSPVPSAVRSGAGDDHQTFSIFRQQIFGRVGAAGERGLSFLWVEIEREKLTVLENRIAARECNLLGARVGAAGDRDGE